ncbi:hypothetical protein [Thiocapsa bogorovii]|uniref:hypothetical protein n=1 Tax=Thiocapsa bogorovii TaxID=521689 RepID=UPI001E507BD9|nr:hypothetical protein [Thiocapsa bogorovii]UHD14913.1 hypothetical protein LT988_16710 [Thiocapsa bogorovii]
MVEDVRAVCPGLRRGNTSPGVVAAVRRLESVAIGIDAVNGREDVDRRLFDAFPIWLSLDLPDLPHLSCATRRGLERAAFEHARLVDAIRRLYPRFFDRDIFSRTRVEPGLGRDRARDPFARPIPGSTPKPRRSHDVRKYP